MRPAWSRSSTERPPRWVLPTPVDRDGGTGCASVVCVLLFKELKLLCFDEGFAGSAGCRSCGLDMVLMGLVVVVIDRRAAGGGPDPDGCTPGHSGRGGAVLDGTDGCNGR